MKETLESCPEFKWLVTGGYGTLEQHYSSKHRAYEIHEYHDSTFSYFFLCVAASENNGTTGPTTRGGLRN